MGYEFSKLNDREFESLGASIIQRVLHTRVEKFKPGKDGGVDGRFWIGSNNEGIIQCKHYSKTPYNQLISKLTSTEATKVKNLKPSRYIFITSMPLSRVNKQEIKGIFSPYILREDDMSCPKIGLHKSVTYEIRTKIIITADKTTIFRRI